MRPLIGVTKPQKGGLTQNIAIWLCLLLSGARPINLKPNRKRFDLPLDGLLLSGGTDLYPGLYDEEYAEEDKKYDRERDELEIEWLKVAMERKLPLFCICRGAQLLNVSTGGSLHQNIAAVYENANYPNSLLAKIFFRKKMTVVDSTKLSRFLCEKEVKVNSLHRQSIDQLGEGLKINAQEENGIVQGIELDSERFGLGFQFHPEFLFYRADVRKLFREFVLSCKTNQMTS
jgi:putative glutamine amidotransferase